jgi:hypothetical protein
MRLFGPKLRKGICLSRSAIRYGFSPDLQAVHGGGISIVDIPRLQRLLEHIDQRGAHFVLSYAFCPEALQAFADWNVAFHYVHRNVAGFRHSRRRAKEILVTNIS